MVPQPSSFVLIPPDCYNPLDLFKLIDRKLNLDMAPISKIHVAAAGIGFSDTVYLGINVELPGLPLHHSIHAVQFLITNLVLNHEPFLITHIAVSAKDPVLDAPCGQCRQFLQEFFMASDIRILRKDPEKGINKYVNLKSLLPHPEVLVPKEGGYLLIARDNELSFFYPDANIREDHDLKNMALEAAKKSFAPYSKCPSGVALKDSNGEMYRGWYLESSALNPIVGPVQAALVDFLIKGGTKFNTIVEAVLVEKKDAVVRQDKTAKMILKTIAPNCVFKSLGPVQAALVEFVIKGNSEFNTIVEAVLVEKEHAVVSQDKTAAMILETIAPNCVYSAFYCHDEPVEP